MRVICIHVVTGIEGYRARVQEKLGRAVWWAMAARFTFDSRLIAMADQHLAQVLLDWSLVESLFGSPNAEPNE